MPLYTFELINGSARASDETGIHAPDRERALAYGKEVARELMRGREVQTRSWRLDIYEDGRECVAEIPFAAIDPTLDHLQIGVPSGDRAFMRQLSLVAGRAPLGAGHNAGVTRADGAGAGQAASGHSRRPANDQIADRPPRRNST